MFDLPPARNFQELSQRLNKQFYENYDVDYFADRAITLSGIVAKPNEFASVLSAGFEIGKIKVGEITDIDTDSLINSSKREVVLNSYHAIETLFRLLFAHVESHDCPWLGLVDLNNPNDFKKRLKQLLDDKYFKEPNSEALPQVFSGNRKVFETLSDEEWDKHKRHIHESVMRMGHDLLSSAEYNVYKHGAALFDTQFGFNFADVINMEKQDTFIYLHKVRDKKEKEITETYYQTYKFTKWEYRFATTMLATFLTNNLINIAAKRLGVKDEVMIRPFNELEPNKFLETGIIADSMGDRLFTNTYARKKKPKK